MPSSAARILTIDRMTKAIRDLMDMGTSADRASGVLATAHGRGMTTGQAARLTLVSLPEGSRHRGELAAVVNARAFGGLHQPT